MGERNILIFLILFCCIYDCAPTLEAVHILFRHGHRTTDRKTLYPKDPYINETYYPYGLGELNKKGKQLEYKLGKILRQRYGDLLGDLYTPDLLEAWSSDTNRTKMSLQLVLAGLFPPSEEEVFETGLNWQPVPFKTVPQAQDTLFMGIFCPRFQQLYNEYLSSPKIKQQSEEYGDIFEYIAEHSGLKVQTVKDVLYLYLCLTTEKEEGFVLPEWTKKVYPEPLKTFAIEAYGIFTATTEMKRLSIGTLLKKIVDDSVAKIEKRLPQKTRKLFLYSGHELNLGPLLITLDVLKDAVLPPYGSYIAFELHKFNNKYGFKIFYEDHTQVQPKALKLPACQTFCPIEQFTYLLEEYFAEKDSCNAE